MFPGRWVLSFECSSLNLRRKRSATLGVDDAVSWAINSDRYAIFEAGMKPMHEPDNAVCSSHSHCFCWTAEQLGIAFLTPTESEAENIPVPLLQSWDNISFEGSKESKHCRFFQANSSQSFEPYTKAVIALFLVPATELKLEPCTGPNIMIL